ncbi:MAG: ribosome-associated translation inhibitor RaiA [Candidatus Staskawiczbacteria bacterium]|nr:ribosome-associated translation inhibitor RaiA [Candidatus Staskawiczbacteria bacterium]
MNIIIKAKNFELTEYLEKFTNDKVGKLEKFLAGKVQEICIEIEKETNHHKKGDLFIASIQIDLPGKSLMAKAHGEDLLAAIIDAKDEMEIEIKKYKTKTIETPRRKIRKEMENEIV